jgi:hypothetical protein
LIEHILNSGVTRDRAATVCRQLSTSNWFSLSIRSLPPSSVQPVPQRQLRGRAPEDIKDDQFFFRKVFANMPFLLFVQAAAERQKFLREFVDVPAARVVGLDPLLGLISGIGDALANLIGTVIGLATRLRVPRIVLTRMSLNLLINGVVGAVPVAGDLFSVWFRSHARNAALLRAAAMKPDRETRPDWFYVGGLVGGTVALMLLAIAFVVWAVAKLWTLIAL